MAALKGGLAVVLCNVSATVKTVHAIVCPKKGPSVMQAISACKRIRVFLNEDEEWQVIIQWCPSHIGIKCNEEVDELAGKLVREDRHPEEVSFVCAKSDILCEVNGE